jgi:hypothetical protein
VLERRGGFFCAFFLCVKNVIKMKLKTNSVSSFSSVFFFSTHKNTLFLFVPIIILLEREEREIFHLFTEERERERERIPPRYIYIYIYSIVDCIYIVYIILHRVLKLHSKTL